MEIASPVDRLRFRLIYQGGKEASAVFALYKNNDKWFVAESTCPHSGGPLYKGQMTDIEDAGSNSKFLIHTILFIILY